MRTTKQTIGTILALLVCALLAFSVFAPAALAATNTDNYACNDNDYSYSDCHSNGYYGYYYSYCHRNFDYIAASCYYRMWAPQANLLGIDVRTAELNHFITLYSSNNYDDYDYITTLTDWTNTKIDKLVAKAQRTPWNDVRLLLYQIDFLVDNVLYWGDITDYQIECIYTPEQIDGQTVMIDPLRVVNTRK
ncbi:MAG: hypothetical protein RR051_00780 [Clostridiales bacterium]